MSETARRERLSGVWPPTAAIAAEAGHKPMSPMEAIRRKCLDCSVYQPSEVQKCACVTCALWPFRAGRHPYTKKALERGDDRPE